MKKNFLFGLYFDLIFFLLGYVGLSDEANIQHQVAFSCGKPAAFKKGDNWNYDINTDCLKDPQEILEFCQKVFPELNVTNVMEEVNPVPIANWCSYGVKNCSDTSATETAIPYRCLHGAFVTEPLVVPVSCVFEHFYDAKSCQSLTQWRNSAAKDCIRKYQYLKSSAPLVPCGTGVFQGLEFVCCPNPDGPQETEKGSANTIGPSSGDHKVSHPFSPHYYQPKPSTVSSTKPKPHVGLNNKDDPYQSYLSGRASTLNEHRQYQAATNRWNLMHSTKVNDILNAWRIALENVHAVRTTDPRRAQRLMENIDRKYRQTYLRLADESEMEQHQLSAIHERHIQENFDTKKRRAMQSYIKMIHKRPIQTWRILKSLKRYIKVEQHDRLHSLNHFLHVKSQHPKYAERIRPQVADHIKLIHLRIRQSLLMLRSLPDAASLSIRVSINRFLRDYSALNKSEGQILKADAFNSSPTTVSGKASTSEHQQPGDTKAKIFRLLSDSHGHVSSVGTEKSHPTAVNPVISSQTVDRTSPQPSRSGKRTSKTLQASESRPQTLPDTSFQQTTDSSRNGVVVLIIGATVFFATLAIIALVIRRRLLSRKFSKVIVEIDESSSFSQPVRGDNEDNSSSRLRNYGFENPVHKYFYDFR